jgi:hypothetical protein
MSIIAVRVNGGGGGGGLGVEPILTTGKSVVVFTYTFFMSCSLFSLQRLEELEEIDCWKKVNNINYILKLIKNILLYLV